MPVLSHAKPAAFYVAAALVAGTCAACTAGGDAPADVDAAAPAPALPAGTRPRLVFFMNPGGRPCQVQDQILRDMSAELFRTAEVVYYRTTEPADLGRFSQYGVRALPMLLVTDADGRELRRATPGIQGPEQIRRLLGP